MSDPARPRDVPITIGFGHHLCPVVLAEEATYLFAEDAVTAVQGEQIAALTPLLDGTRDLDAVLTEAFGVMPVASARAALGELADAGLVVARPAGVQQSEDSAFWEGVGADTAAARDRLRSARVRIVDLGDAPVGDRSAGPVERALRDAGLRDVTTLGRAEIAASSSTSADLTVVLCRDYTDLALTALAAALHATGAPWLLARPGGRTVWIGPVFRGAHTACLACLTHRIWGHRQAESHVQRSRGLADAPVERTRAGLPALDAAAAQLVALEAVKWLCGRADLETAVWTFDGWTSQARTHEVRRRPECPGCGNPAQTAARAWVGVELTARPALARDGGGARASSAQDVLDAYGHLISPITGVVGDIRRDPRGPRFLNSFRAGGNVAAGADSLTRLRAGLRAENGGKGVTETHARASALCESLERHSAQFRGDEARLFGSYRTLGERAVHPDSMLLFDPRQRAERTAWNAAHSAFQYVCADFDDDAELDWTPVWSLTHRRHRLVPTAMLYYGAAGPDSVVADSNGCAAGASLEDAVLHGLLELVERDAVALWWYNRTRQPALDLASAGDPWLGDLIRVHEDLHREVWALDLTSDLGVPVVVALSRRTDKAAEDIVFGFGADLDLRTAARRALTELDQVLPAVVDVPQHAGLDAYGCDDADAVRWWWTATRDNQRYLCPDPAQPAVPVAAAAGSLPEDLLAAVDLVRGRIEQRGMEVLVLDQTRADIGLPVAKVLVPGLRSMWRRLAPGRLFDVPVALGRCAAPTAFEDLNPVPLFV